MKNPINLISITLILSIAYCVEVMILSGILIAIGMHFPEARVSQQVSIIQLIISGLISAVFASYIITNYRLNKISAFLILFFILFFSNISVAIEGSLFTPEYITGNVLMSLFFQQLLISIAFSLTAILIFHKKLSTDGESLTKNGNLSLFVKVLFGSLVYMFMYYFWGKLNYTFFTHTYYDSGMSGLHIPDSSTLIKIIIFRGLLITLSVVPFLLKAMPDKRRKIFETGCILFIFGGIIPMVFSYGMLPKELIFYSLAEIFLQNFITGMVIYKIFNYRRIYL
jgi:hypothetical protein